MKRVIRIGLHSVLAALLSAGVTALPSSGQAVLFSPVLAAGLSAGLLLTGCADIGEPVEGTGIPGIDVVEGYVVQDYAYSAYDTSGRLLVSGRLRIAVQDKGTVSRKVMGTWELERKPGVLPEETGPQEGKGSLDGLVSGDEMDGISMNLNPAFIDNNVILHGSITPSQIRGTWSYVGYPGVIAEGPFIASVLDCCGSRNGTAGP